MTEIKPCPFCGSESTRLNFHQTKYYGRNGYGAKKIKFTGYIVCNKCLSRGKPISVISDRVDCRGWYADLKEEMLPIATEAWNRRADND